MYLGIYFTVVFRLMSMINLSIQPNPKQGPRRLLHQSQQRTCLFFPFPSCHPPFGPPPRACRSARGSAHPSKCEVDLVLSLTFFFFF